MKKLAGITAVLLLTGCTSASAYTPGTYTGTGEGNNGPVTVEVTVSENAIEKVEITEQQETDGIADNALANMPGKIVQANSTDVDIEAGCTNTSEAIIEAVQDALKKAK